MVKKACFALIVAMCPVSLFAGETMVTHTTRVSTKCDFRVDKCETSVAEDPSDVHFVDGPTLPRTTDVHAVNGDPARCHSHFGFADYTDSNQPTVEQLLAIIRSKLGNCPEVTISYDNDTGDITVHYLQTTCDCDCDWVVNVRNVTADDFVWKRTTDNYSNRLGQMERRKFHTTSQKDAQDIETACAQICTLNAWTKDK